MNDSRRTSDRVRLRVLLLVTVLTIAGAVWAVSQTQRSTADRAFAQSRTGQQMLTAMLDQETGLRGFALSRQEEFLEPFVRGARNFNTAIETARRNGDQGEALDDQVGAARQWQMLARDEIKRLRARKDAPLSVAYVQTRKAVFDRYRGFNAEFQQQVGDARRQALEKAGLVSVAVIIGLGVLFGGLGYLGIERSAAAVRRRQDRERDFRQAQAEFNETMQVMRDEEEAYSLVRQHLERSIPDAEVVVLSRNNSANRLIAASTVREGSPFAAALADAEPESCLSVRLAREHRRGEGADPLLVCGICGLAAGETTCVPSVVSGQVIGSVLVQHPERLNPEHLTA